MAMMGRTANRTPPATLVAILDMVKKFIGNLDIRNQGKVCGRGDPGRFDDQGESLVSCGGK